MLLVYFLMLPVYAPIDHALSRAERGLVGQIVVGGLPKPKVFAVLPPYDRAAR